MSLFVLPQHLWIDYRAAGVALNSDVIEWLREMQVTHRFVCSWHYNDKNPILTKLQTALQIEDPDHAVLFKLTWL